MNESTLRKGVPARPAGGKTPKLCFLNLIPALPARRRHAGGKDGASDFSYITVNSDNYPDIFCPVGKNDRIRDVGGKNTKINGNYSDLTFPE